MCIIWTILAMFVGTYFLANLFINTCIIPPILREQKRREKYGVHIQAKRGSKEQLDKYCGVTNEIVLDLDNWKLRKYNGKDPGGKELSGEALYFAYKNTDSLCFCPEKMRGRFFVGGKRGEKFYRYTYEENQKNTLPVGEIVEIIDRNMLVVHDGVTAGGIPL